MTRMVWDDQSDEFLRRYYCERTARWCAGLVRCEVSSVYQRARRLGLNVSTAWLTDDQIRTAVIELHAIGWTDEEIKRELKRRHSIDVDRHRISVLRRALDLGSNANKSEQTLAGQAMLRVDVPQTNKQKAFTKFFGPGSIHSLTPTTETIARGLAEQLDNAPISVYDLPIATRQKLGLSDQQLANLVEQSEDWIVTAIGRFVLLDELQLAKIGKFDHELQWMVAIMEIGDCRSLTKLTCMQDWHDLNRAVVHHKCTTPQTIAQSPQNIPEPVQVIAKTTQGIPNGMLF